MDASTITSSPTGTKAEPYPSTVAAFLAHGPDASIIVKKAKLPSAPAEEAAPDFEPITGSGLKKAKKLYELEKKKLDKAEAGKEKAAKEAEESRKREEKKREEAKSIVLTEDPSLEKAIRVRFSSCCYLCFEKEKN